MGYDSKLDSINFRLLNFTVTERCTLKCKDCAYLMQYYENPRDYDIDMLCSDFDKFLECVDSILDLEIIGGEPFMNKNFHKIIERYCNNTKISVISIVTNATILPTDEQWLVFRSPKIRFIITNYGGLSRKVSEMIDLLEKFSIDYTVNPLSWKDLGGLYYRGYSEKELEDVFKQCRCNNVPAFVDGKLYDCFYAAHADNLGAIPKGDYVDFRDGEDTSNHKEQIKKLLRDRKYFIACGYCNGVNVNAKEIVAAIQTSVPLKYKKINE